MQHVEVPRLGVELELQLPAYTTATAMRDSSCNCNLHHSSWECQTLNPLSETRDQTHILKDTSQVCYRWAMTGTLFSKFLIEFTCEAIWFWTFVCWKFFLCVFFCFVFFFRATPQAYGGFQARGQIGGVVAGLHHSNTRSLIRWVRPRIKSTTSWFLVRFISTEPRELLICMFLMPFC